MKDREENDLRFIVEIMIRQIFNCVTVDSYSSPIMRNAIKPKRAQSNPICSKPMSNDQSDCL